LTDQATRVVPAGWYEDPASTAHVRWWNGLAWTEHTAIKPTPTPVVQPTAAAYTDGFGSGRYGDGYSGQEQVTTATGSTTTPETLARIAEARELERQYGISTAENDIIMQAAHGGAGQGAATYGAANYGAASTGSDYRPWNAEPEPVYEEPGTNTASVWFIALWPLLTLAAAATAAYLAFYVMPEPSVAGIPVVAAVAVVPTLLTLIWAATDARRLRLNGYQPASPALALLGPLIYLIGRRVRVPGSGPLALLLVLTVIAAGAPTAAYLTGYAVPVTKALEIQQTVQADLVGSGELASVSCPVFVEDVAMGSLYSCNGVLPDGGEKLVWVSIDTDEGDFSYALAVR
jgi:hypothetical protein